MKNLRLLLYTRTYGILPHQFEVYCSTGLEVMHDDGNETVYRNPYKIIFIRLSALIKYA